MLLQLGTIAGACSSYTSFTWPTSNFLKRRDKCFQALIKESTGMACSWRPQIHPQENSFRPHSQHGSMHHYNSCSHKSLFSGQLINTVATSSICIRASFYMAESCAERGSRRQCSHCSDEQYVQYSMPTPSYLQPEHLLGALHALFSEAC